MIKNILLLLLILGLSFFGITWLNQNSGELSFILFDMKIETSVTATAVVLLVVFTVLLALLNLLSKIFTLPSQIQRYMKEKNMLETISNLSNFIFSYSTDEISDARKFIKRLDKDLVKENIITIADLLLDKKENNIKSLKPKLISLTKNKDTATSAYTELLQISLSEEDWIQAANYSNEIWKDERNPIVAKHFFSAMIKLERWEELLVILDKSRLVTMFSKDYSSYLSKEEHTNILMYVKYRLALNYTHLHEYQKSLALLSKTMDQLPTFTPAFELAAKILLIDKKPSDALKVIKKAWKHKPTSNLTAFAIESCKALYDQNIEKIYSTLKSIATINPKSYESNILLAIAALESERYDIASTQISEALDSSKKQRACVLMAEYCQRTHGNKLEAIRWLREALNTESDSSPEDFYWDQDSFSITNFICHKIDKLTF